MKICTLSECLNLMHAGESFSLVWVTADKQRKRGGEILSVENARLCTAQLYTGSRQTGSKKGRGKSANRPGGLKQAEKQRVGLPADQAQAMKEKKELILKMMESKNPNHWENGTRNIVLSNGKIRKVHVQLILEINGFKVLN